MKQFFDEFDVVSFPPQMTGFCVKPRAANEPSTVDGTAGKLSHFKKGFPMSKTSNEFDVFLGSVDMPWPTKIFV